MQLDDNIYEKFPSILKEKLQGKEIEFPENTMFEYEPILAYRAVERKKEDHTPISLNDFKSYCELNKRPKRLPRGKRNDCLNDPHYYGVSSFLKREMVEQIMKFPNPNKKMAVGYVHMESGPQETKDQHICWWLYVTADVSGFKIEEDCDG